MDTLHTRTVCPQIMTFHAVLKFLAWSSKWGGMTWITPTSRLKNNSVSSTSHMTYIIRFTLACFCSHCMFRHIVGKSTPLRWYINLSFFLTEQVSYVHFTNKFFHLKFISIHYASDCISEWHLQHYVYCTAQGTRIHYSDSGRKYRFFSSPKYPDGL
jgi:hypothetical protein